MDSIESLRISGDATLAPVAALVVPAVEAMGFVIVRIAHPDGDADTLQVMVEHPDGSAIRAGECSRISRAVSDLLDEADPIEAEYMLEVSSPGIGRPLTRRADFTAWAGYAVMATMRTGSTDGTLVGLEGDQLVLNSTGGATKLALADLTEVRLVLDDKLMAATKPATEQVD